MVDRIEDKDFDVQVIMAPVATNEKYQLELPEKETMETIERLATALFTLLNQTQPKTSPMIGVIIVVKKPSETTIFDTDGNEVKDTAQEAILPTPEIIEIPEPAQETSPIAPPHKLSREQVELMIESYHQQIRLLSQSAAQERQLLKTHEQIQILKPFKQGSSYSISPAEDPKIDLLRKIASFEGEIQQAQRKILELQQTLQDIRG